CPVPPHLLLAAAPLHARQLERHRGLSATRSQQCAQVRQRRRRSERDRREIRRGPVCARSQGAGRAGKWGIGSCVWGLGGPQSREARTQTHPPQKMTDKQEKLYWRLWGRVVHANDWRFYKGRVMESAALNNSAHHLAVW